MKKKYNLSVLICSLFAIFTFGCSSLEVSQDYKPGFDFSSLKTYAWKHENQEKTGDRNIDSSLMDERVRRATQRVLSQKGFVKSSDKSPDFYVIYDYSITRRIHSSPVNTDMGGGYWNYGRGTINVRTGTQINEYDEGLLIIDFLKPDSDIVLWRGKSTRVVETHSTPEDMIKDIDETIGALLAQFPPGRQN